MRVREREPPVALAILIALKIKFGQEPNDRGNGAALNKLMSTGFPSSAVLMELASFMKTRGMRTIVEWAPRECNKEADLLANGKTSLFDPKRRIHVAASSLVWNVLPEASASGREVEEAFRQMKEVHGQMTERVRIAKQCKFHPAIGSLSSSSISIVGHHYS